MKSQTFQLDSFESTKNLAKYLVTILKNKTLVLVDGPLGAGKTTLIRYVAEELGLASAASPTFSIHQRYQGNSHVLDHVDLYRIESEEDLETTGFWELLSNENSFVFVEWSERIPESYWPKDWTTVHLKFKKEKDHAALVFVEFR